MTQQKQIDAWVKWLARYGAENFARSFVETVENAESTCVHCGERIYVDILTGGGCPDWSTEDGDSGCPDSPDTNEDGTGGHVPRKRSTN